MSHNAVYLFSTPNLGNYQADMTISPLALNQSKLLKYFQQIIMVNIGDASRVLPQLQTLVLIIFMILIYNTT